MSANYSKNKSTQPGVISLETPPTQQINQRFASVGLIWIVLSWLAATMLIVPMIVLGLATLFGRGFVTLLLNQNLVLLLALNFLYAPFAFGLIWLLFKPYLRKHNLRFKSLIGLKRPKLNYLLYALPGYAIYYIVSLALSEVVVRLVPNVNLNQTQNLGIAMPNSLLDYVLTFVMLVVIPPVIEETLFRGFLFGTVRRGFPWLVSALVTSALFGIAHGQINLFLDTFALSMVLCYLREKTGSIWTGVGLHALKNGIAFVLLYIVKVNIG